MNPDRANVWFGRRARKARASDSSSSVKRETVKERSAINAVGLAHFSSPTYVARWLIACELEVLIAFLVLVEDVNKLLVVVPLADSAGRIAC